MLRTITVQSDTTLQALSSTLIDARFSDAQATAALAQIQAFNPHADPQKIAAGTVLFVPDAPAVKTSAGTAPQAQPLDDFHTLLSNALNDAASSLKAGNAQRAADRTALAAALTTDAFTKAVGTDATLAQQVNAAQQSIIADATADAQAEAMLATIGQSALAALAQLRTVTG
jgi:hypothetical protein